MVVTAAKPGPVVTSEDARPRPTLVGGAGTQIRAGFQVYDDPNTETRGTLWRGDSYRNGLSWQMRRDPIVRMSLDAHVAPLLAGRVDVEPAGKSERDAAIARAVRWQFLEALPWQHMIETGTADYLADGFTLWEFTDAVRPLPRNLAEYHPQPDAAIVFTGVHHRPTWTVYQWHQSANDPTKADGFSQKILGSDAEAPGIKTVKLSEGALFMRLTHGQQGADFEGFPLLRSSYGDFKAKRLLTIVKMIYFERAGNAIPKITEPNPTELSGSSEQSEREIKAEILRNIRVHEQSYIAPPPGWEFEWSQPANAPQGLGEAINSCDYGMAYPFNTGFMLLSGGSSAGTGSRALATEQRGQYALNVERHARAWEYALNVGADGWSPVERFVRLNYGPDVGVPRVRWRAMPLRDMTQMLTVVPQLIQTRGVVVDAPFREAIRLALDAPMEDPTTAEPLPEPATPSASPEATP